MRLLVLVGSDEPCPVLRQGPAELKRFKNQLMDIGPSIYSWGQSAFIAATCTIWFAVHSTACLQRAWIKPRTRMAPAPGTSRLIYDGQTGREMPPTVKNTGTIPTGALAQTLFLPNAALQRFGDPLLLE